MTDLKITLNTSLIGKVDTTKEDNAIRALKAEISRKASMANKRLARLEKNNLTDTPAYKSYIDNGGTKFSVRGKSYNELQTELKRVNHFINAKTSTVRGAHAVVKEIASSTGIKYARVGELYAKSNQFFQLASKVEQYLNNMNGVAASIGYQKIWTQINDYVKTEQIELGNSLNDVEAISEAVSKILAEQQSKDAKNDIFDAFTYMANHKF